MRYSAKLSDAVHVLSYVVIYADDDLSSAAIARSIESNPSVVRRIMARLAKAGLIITHPGVVHPELGRPAAQISLLDVYQAVEDDQRLLHVDEKTNPACIVGGNIQAALNEIYDSVQRNAEAQMAEVTLQSIIDDILVREAARHR